MAPTRGKQKQESNVMEKFAHQLVDAFRQYGNAANAHDLVSSLPEFTGNQSTAEAKEWLRNIESQAEIYQWADKIKLEAARRKLKGGARSWLLLHDGAF